MATWHPGFRLGYVGGSVYSIMIIVFKRLIKSSVVDLIANLALTDNKQNIAGSFLKEQG